MTENPYHPPQKWVWDKESAAHSQTQPPCGRSNHEKHCRADNASSAALFTRHSQRQKVTILLEELLSMGYEGAEYDAHLINIRDRDQFGSEFVSINPNSKIPAMVDHSGDKPIRIFESEQSCLPG